MSTTSKTYWTTKPSILKPIRDRVVSLYEAVPPELTGEWDAYDILEQLEAEGYDLQAVAQFLLEQFVWYAGGDHITDDIVGVPASLEEPAELPPLHVLESED